MIDTEAQILRVALDLQAEGTPQFWGFVLTDKLQRLTGTPWPVGYGTIYRALNRLERMGFVASRWEQEAIARDDGRPRRRLYWLLGDPQEAIYDFECSKLRQTRVASLPVGAAV